MQADKESLEQTIGTLESSLDVLNDKLEDAKERERLIVEYPDINGPVNPDLTGTMVIWAQSKKLLSCSVQLSMKFQLLMETKMLKKKISCC